jgi:hypothetical protein
MVAGHRRAASLLGGKMFCFFTFFCSFTSKAHLVICVWNSVAKINRVYFAGDDAEPDVRAGGNGARRAPDRHRGCPVQDHEGGRTAADSVRAVPRQVHQGGQNDRPSNA